jgi:ribosomal-protein-alanine acetyltransferase
VNPVYRPLSPTDLDELTAIERRCFSSPWSHGQLAASIQHHLHLGLQTNTSAPLTGYAFLMPVLEEFHLLNLAIDLPWQGQGWGRRLLDQVLKTARQHGAQSILLEVRAGHTIAQHLYQNAQFTLIGIRRGYYATDHPTRREDALVMRRQLYPDHDT